MKLYASKYTFNKHKESKRHKSYELKNQEFDHRKTITSKDIEISRINTKYNELLLKFQNLEKRYKNLKQKNLQQNLLQQKQKIE